MDNGYELSQKAAVAMWGGAASSFRGYPVWKRQPGMMFGRYVPTQPNGAADSFRPDVDARHAAEFREWAMDMADERGITYNYGPQVIHAQSPQLPGENVHPRPQVRYWHSKIIISVSKADKYGVVGTLFEWKDRSQTYADTVTFLAFVEWMKNG